MFTWALPVMDCLAKTAEINSDATLVAARVAAVTGVIELKDPLTCGTSGDKLKCEYDFGDLKDNLLTVCEAAEGILVETSFDITCKLDGSSGKITYIFDDTPYCAAQSCDESKYYEALQYTADEIAKQMNMINGLKDCGAEISAAGPSQSGLFVLSVSALLALAML